MKRNTFVRNQIGLPQLISVLLVLILLVTGIPGRAFADVRINNQIKESGGNTVVIGSAGSGQPGLDLVLSTGDQNTIDMPKRWGIPGLPASFTGMKITDCMPAGCTGTI